MMGLQWLVRCFDHGVNAILADEMVSGLRSGEQRGKGGAVAGRGMKVGGMGMLMAVVWGHRRRGRSARGGREGRGAVYGHAGSLPHIPSCSTPCFSPPPCTSFFHTPPSPLP